MTRVLSLILGTVILLGIGFYLGRRPVKDLAKQVDEVRSHSQIRMGEMEAQASLAEARSLLSEARADLLQASFEAGEKRFETASVLTDKAKEALIQSSRISGMDLDLSEADAMIERAVVQLGNDNPAAKRTLAQAALLLAQALDRKHA
ncbi:MAG: hypothetical protein HKN21_09365 [Candidatus Eisenbacteria bacterium]|uniref:Uncharacterized protein n=1 Tax=Eiseniibacteriota bacterium TaxID=2212470 RepID=A0A7Y2E878_UNCEI|nr:hypothetical protein [Candidatus Eisenbacteria bacterium]